MPLVDIAIDFRARLLETSMGSLPFAQCLLSDRLDIVAKPLLPGTALARLLLILVLLLGAPATRPRSDGAS